MTTTPVMEPTDPDEREILNDPEVQRALAELDDPEDREDLIDALVIEKRIKEGKENSHTSEEVKAKLGL